MVVEEGFGDLKKLGCSTVYLLSADGKRNKDLLKIMGVTSGMITHITKSLLAMGALDLDYNEPGRPFVANPEALIKYVQTSDIARLLDEARPGILNDSEKLQRRVVKNFIDEYDSGLSYAIESRDSWPREYKERIPFKVLVHPILNKEKNIFAAFSEHILSANLLLVAEEMQKLGHEDMLPRIRELSEERLSGHISSLDISDILRSAVERDFIDIDADGEMEPAYSTLFKKCMSYNSKTNNLQREIIFKVMRGENIEYLMDTADALSSNSLARIMLVFFSNQEYGRSEWFTIRDLLLPEKAKVITTQPDLLNRAGGIIFWDLMSQLTTPFNPIHPSASGDTAADMWDLFTPIMSPDLVATSEKLFRFGMRKMLEEFTKGYMEHEMAPRVITKANDGDDDIQ